MTVEFSLHRVVSTMKKPIGDKEYLLLISTIPGNHTGLHSTPDAGLDTLWPNVVLCTYIMDSFIACINSIGEACGDDVTKRTLNSWSNISQGSEALDI